MNKQRKSLIGFFVEKYKVNIPKPIENPSYFPNKFTAQGIMKSHLKKEGVKIKPSEH